MTSVNGQSGKNTKSKGRNSHKHKNVVTLVRGMRVTIQEELGMTDTQRICDKYQQKQTNTSKSGVVLKYQ